MAHHRLLSAGTQLYLVDVEISESNASAGFFFFDKLLSQDNIEVKNPEGNVSFTVEVPKEIKNSPVAGWKLNETLKLG